MKLGFLPLFKASFGVLLVGAAALAGLAGLNLYTYQRFTEELPVARLSFQATGANVYVATLQVPEKPAVAFTLAGDEWQLDVRMIKWTDWLTFLGEAPMYRLDRISGRYISIDEARRNGQMMHPLADPAGVDVWAFARRAGDWIPGIDAAYGSSVFLPMEDGAVYEVTISRTGLLARRVEREAGR